MMREHTKRILLNGSILFLLFTLLGLILWTWFGDIQPGSAQRRQMISTMLGGLFWDESDADNLYPGYEEYDDTMSILSPVRAAVQNNGALTYLTNREEVRDLFERVGALLSATMDTDSVKQELNLYQWRSVLSGNMVFFDFEGEIPSDVLAEVIGADHNLGEELHVRYLVLSTSSDGLVLTILSKNGTPISYKTVVSPSELESLIREFESSNAFFAFEDRTLSSHLPDEFVVLSHREDPVIIKKSSPFSDYASTASERIINAVLESFGYNAYTTGGYIESDGTRVYVEELSTLRISPTGALSYYAPLPDEVKPSAPEGSERTSIIMNAASMLNQVASDYIGDITPYVLRAYYDEAEQQYIVLFGCVADGIVLSFEDGYFARLEYTGGVLVGAHLTIASYVMTAQTDAILSDYQIAATVDGKCSLFELRYIKNQSNEYHASWYYQKQVD